MKPWRMDMSLVLVILALVILGAVMIYSASGVKAERDYSDHFHFFVRQAVFCVIGLAAMIACFLVPCRFWYWAVVPVLLLTFALLVLVLTPAGYAANHASRWLRLGPVSLQPAEFAKLAVVMYLARYFSARGEESRMGLGDILRPMAVVGIVVALVAAEPDLGTAIFIGVLGAAVLFVAGVPVPALAVAGLAASPVVFYLIAAKDFRLRRIYAFLDPWKEYDGSGFQLAQSLIALGNGGLMGRGVGAGKSKLLFLPESHTDFILAVVGEEMGFVGVSVVLALFAVFVLRGFKASSASPDLFGRYLAAGITLMIGMQALLNSMVVLGLLPTKGLPMPFVSYGGSSLLVSLVASGILLRIASDGREE